MCGRGGFCVSGCVSYFGLVWRGVCVVWVVLALIMAVVGVVVVVVIVGP